MNLKNKANRIQKSVYRMIPSISSSKTNLTIGMHNEVVNCIKGKGLVITKVWEKGSSAL